MLVLLERQTDDQMVDWITRWRRSYESDWPHICWPLYRQAGGHALKQLARLHGLWRVVIPPTNEIIAPSHCDKYLLTISAFNEPSTAATAPTINYELIILAVKFASSIAPLPFPLSSHPAEFPPAV